MHMYSLRAFQWYQEHNGGCCGSEDPNVTNKTHKLPSLINMYFRVIFKKEFNAC